MSTPAVLVDQALTGLREVLGGSELAGLPDEERMQVLRALGETLRLCEAAVVETVASADVDFAHSFGCRGENELLRRTLRVDAATAARFGRAVRVVKRNMNIVSGERLPARWPALRESLLSGAVGVTGLLAATAPLEQASDRIRVEDRLWADEVLAALADGRAIPSDAASDVSPVVERAERVETSRPPATLDELRQAALILAMGLDPDGVEPTDMVAQQRRGVTIGRVQDGVHRIHGTLLPEVAAQLQLIFDAYTNPKTAGPPMPGVRFRESDDGDAAGAVSAAGTAGAAGAAGAVGAAGAEADPWNVDDRAVIDGRSPAQKRHDAFAAAIGIAARHEEMPSLGGAAPTLVVHVNATDLESGEGWATVPGAQAPVPLTVAAHTACAGAVQRVIFDDGRIVGIHVIDRVFTAHQRRAITLRDQECLIPGCHVPASWCEIHHVTEHANGGPTHTDNGVPLCWWHHRSLGSSGWEIRMNQGLPEIRGPGWWDPTFRWHTPRHSLPRGRQHHRARAG